MPRGSDTSAAIYEILRLHSPDAHVARDLDSPQGFIAIRAFLWDNLLRFTY